MKHFSHAADCVYAVLTSNLKIVALIGCLAWLQLGSAQDLYDVDVLLVEIHPQPDSAVSDRNQTLYFDQAARLVEGGRQFRELRKSL